MAAGSSDPARRDELALWQAQATRQSDTATGGREHQIMNTPPPGIYLRHSCGLVAKNCMIVSRVITPSTRR